ncbi:MAG: LysR substrate-binding domain-containing protein, partial [Pseudomonadales bacterium]
VLLGAMRYRAMASPGFIARNFPTGVTAQALAHAPGIVFGPDDLLQHRYLSGLGVEGGFAHHLCPSSEGFIRLAQAGFGWGLIPELQVQGEIARGELVELISDRPIDVPLYWHHWRNGGELLNQLTHHLTQAAGHSLVDLRK